MLPSQTAAYHPEELSLFGQVLDSAVEALPPGLRTASNRMAIARNIFKLAATGVRDPFQLQLAATTNLKIPAPTAPISRPSSPPVWQSHNRLAVAAQLPPFRQTRMTSSLHE
jgi:hypothetical protein